MFMWAPEMELGLPSLYECLSTLSHLTCHVCGSEQKLQFPKGTHDPTRSNSSCVLPGAQSQIDLD